MSRHKRLNFSDRVKAEIYARDKAICAFCGCDLWMFRHGVSPHTGHDWADHIRPSSRGGGNSPDNGITACHACNIKKSDNTRDKEYFFQGGQPTHHYYGRFDLPNPLVQEVTRANNGLVWSDWYFNRAIAKLIIATDDLRDLDLGYEGKKRTPEYWVTAGLRFADEWRRYDPAGIEGLRLRGLIGADLAPDQKLLLQFFESGTAKEGLEVARALVPWGLGHRFFHALKCHAFADPKLGDVVGSVFGQAVSDEAVETLLRNPYVAAHDLVEYLDNCDIVDRDGDRLRPQGIAGWPPLPGAKMGALLNQLRGLDGAIEARSRQGAMA